MIYVQLNWKKKNFILFFFHKYFLTLSKLFVVVVCFQYKQTTKKTEIQQNKVDNMMMMMKMEYINKLILFLFSLNAKSRRVWDLLVFIYTKWAHEHAFIQYNTKRYTQQLFMLCEIMLGMCYDRLGLATIFSFRKSLRPRFTIMWN